MAEYIKREAVLRAVQGQRSPCRSPAQNRILDCLKAAVIRISAADVAPVVHGRWEWFDEETGTPSTGYEREWGWRCSHCKEELPDDYDDPDDRPAFRFCYNCGAKMDGGDGDAAD